MNDPIPRNSLSRRRAAATGPRGRVLLTITMVVAACLPLVVDACDALARPIQATNRAATNEPGPPGAADQPGQPPGAQPAPPPGAPGQPLPPPPVPIQPQPAVSSPTLTVDPPAAIDAPVQWTLVFPTTFCGGPHIGGFVQLSFEPPLAVPSTIPDGSVVIADQPATVVMTDSHTLQIAPSPEVIWSHLCSNELQDFSGVITPGAGVAAPASPGTYTVDFATGADPTVTPLAVSFEDPSATTSSP